MDKGTTITVTYWGDAVVTTPGGNGPGKTDKPDKGNGKGNKG